MLSDIQKLALSKIDLSVEREVIPPGTHRLAPFTVEVSGTLVVAPPETYAPTADIPLLPVVALALKKMGVQREHFLNLLRESVTEVLAQSRDMRQTLAAQSGLVDFEQEFKNKVIAQLPRKTRNGKVNATLQVVSR